jgi:hypothetical protein
MDRVNGEPYLERYYVFLKDRKRFPFNIFVHKFLKSDPDDVHDHPWPYATLILKGGYWEWRPQFDAQGNPTYKKDAAGNISQTNESAKFVIDDPTKPNQVRQYRDQINAAFDSIGASRIGIVARNANGKGLRAPSPISFMLEGVIMLYDKIDIEHVWEKTTIAHFKKNVKTGSAKNKYQNDAYDIAYYLMNQ